MSAKGAASILKRRLLGVGFIVLVLGGVALSVAGFNHAFDDYTTVSMQTDAIGNQLGKKADVKARGLIVGYVSKVTPTPEGATLELRLEPDKAQLVPKSASARILPKTLFGERFVSLEFDNAAGPKLNNGDIIPMDRSKSATELYAAFEKLLPVLQAVQPQKLNSTLTAMSNALRGRGKDFGATLSELGAYFGELNPQLPKLQQNLDELAKFANNLADATPDVLATLDNFRASAKTLVEKQQSLQSVYSTVMTASGDLESFIAANKQNIIQVNKVSKPTLQLLAKYSPEIPCVAEQMADSVPVLDKALGKGTGNPGLRAIVKVAPNRGEYEPARDEPEFNFTGPNGYRGPWCIDPTVEGVPAPFPYPYKFLYMDGGGQRPPDARSDWDETGIQCDMFTTFGRPMPAEWLKLCKPGTYPKREFRSDGGGGGATGSDSVANSPAEHSILSELLSLQTGANASDIPGWSGLLVGPLYRGAEVEIE